MSMLLTKEKRKKKVKEDKLEIRIQETKVKNGKTVYWWEFYNNKKEIAMSSFRLSRGWAIRDAKEFKGYLRDWAGEYIEIYYKGKVIE